MIEYTSSKEKNRYETASNSLYSFHVCLFSEDGEMRELWLPKSVEGFYRFSDFPEHRFCSFEPRNEKWSVLCSAPACFVNVKLSESNEVTLCDEKLLRIENGEKTFTLYIENALKDHNIFKHYNVPRDVCIRLGRNPDNDILYGNKYVSRNHALLTRKAGIWEIEDLGSTYGTYVNGEKIHSMRLNLGDVIYIMGMRIIIGIDFISINDSARNITINSQKLTKPRQLQVGYSHYYTGEERKANCAYFNREPRKRLSIPDRMIDVEAPPMSMSQSQMPLLLRMGSSMVMGGSAALAGHYTMLLSSVLFPMLGHKYTEKEKQEYEKLRVEKYTEYLDVKKQEIAEACIEEQRILNRMYPSLNDIQIKYGKLSRLWERRPGDNDFMCIRLGLGNSKLSAIINYPERHFELEHDNLEEEMYRLVENPPPLKNVPLTISLSETPVLGIVGAECDCREYLLQIISQISVFHSCDEVKLVFLLDQCTLELMDFIRFLPHVWDEQYSMRFIATNKSEAFLIGDYLQTQIKEDLNTTGDMHKILKQRPFYLFCVTDSSLLEGHEFLKKLLKAELLHGISFIFTHRDLPKECEKIISLEDGKKGICRSLNSTELEDQRFTIDYFDEKQISEILSTVCNTRIKTVTQAQDMPKMITFLDMFNAGRIEQINALKRWKENNPTISLEAPVGFGTDGKIFTLDLHEKRQGPHGLVAGMTGSGKSEFLITYILSMAVNYHPYEVAFVLIDYKGGGLAGAFENPVTGTKLPHLVGTITNLDGSSIDRSLRCIESEIIHRQKVFSQIQGEVNEGTMDIYSYQKLFREGRVSEPMPHLFIVSDEFAELKQQQPEFMAKLISIARIGRSLGVHLILATQKPSGIVDEQIRSNTKFRVCLKVQDKSDSMDMLQRPEATELTDTGRFYLQVGYNEYFALGQSAWCGADYEPTDAISVRKDENVEFIDIAGQVIHTAKPRVNKTVSGIKQVVAVVNYLSELAEMLEVQPRNLCPPELPEKIDLEQLQRRYAEKVCGEMSVCFGLMDDPENQTQLPLIFDFEHCQNMLIIGDIGTGKTTAIQSILYSLCSKLSPEDFNFYILDYSSRLMKLFKHLPHCGGVLYEEESDSLDNFFNIVNEEISKRKKLFSLLEVDSFEAARKKERIPLILVVIDNLVGLSLSKEGEAISYKLPAILKSSSNYGVKFIISASHFNETSSRIRQELGETICFQMKDKYDYSELLGCKVTYIPRDVAGRGLVKFQDKSLEFHAGLMFAYLDEKERIYALKEALSKVGQAFCNSNGAMRIPVLDGNSSYEDFVGQFALRRIPIGFSIMDAKPVALPLMQFSLLGVYIGTNSARKSIISNILYAVQRENIEIWIAKRNENSIFNDNPDGISLRKVKNSDSITCTEENLKLLNQALLSTMASHREYLENYYSEHKLDENDEASFPRAFDSLYKNTTPVFLLIENVADFCKASPVILLSAFEVLFSKSAKRNVYIVGCFSPDDQKQFLENSLVALFSRNNMLLFGGNLDKQRIHSVPPGVLPTNNILPNVGIMKYRNKNYPILMPCGEITVDLETDPDMENIF